MVILEDGMPRERSISSGVTQYFRVYVGMGGKTDVSITATPLSGDIDMYVSTTMRRPNATAFDWSSATASQAGAEGVVIMHTDPTLLTCLHHSPHCVLFVAVVGRHASQYTMLAALDTVNSGFRVDSPVSVADNYVFTKAAFGPSLPADDSISANMMMASPADACLP